MNIKDKNFLVFVLLKALTDWTDSLLSETMRAAGIEIETETEKKAYVNRSRIIPLPVLLNWLSLLLFSMILTCWWGFDVIEKRFFNNILHFILLVLLLRLFADTIVLFLQIFLTVVVKFGKICQKWMHKFGNALKKISRLLWNIDKFGFRFTLIKKKLTNV